MGIALRDTERFAARVVFDLDWQRYQVLIQQEAVRVEFNRVLTFGLLIEFSNEFACKQSFRGIVPEVRVVRDADKVGKDISLTRKHFYCEVYLVIVCDPLVVCYVRF